MVNSLIIGSSGQVGEEVCRLLEQHSDHKFTPTFFKNKTDYIKNKNPINMDLNNIDITIFNNNYDIIWLCGANTSVDEIEKSNFNDNFNGPKNIIDICSNLKKKPLIIFLSTDYIYDGECGPYNENYKANPINKYGAQKLEAERYIYSNYNRFIIIRTTWVYSAQKNGTNFVMRLIKYLEEGNEANIPLDEFSTPTYASDIPNAILSIIKREDYLDKENIKLYLNISSGELVSKYEFAKNIAKKFKLNGSLIKPIRSIDILREAKRPLKSGLDINKLLSYNYKPLNVEDGLDKIIERTKEY
jgi:dTDP-4-dehydrorhamnose reductase